MSDFINTLEMYAIVDIAGQQFKVEEKSFVYAHRLEGEEGSKVEFDKAGIEIPYPHQVEISKPFK